MENLSTQETYLSLNNPIQSLSGLFKTVSTVPTHIPRKFDEQFIIYANGTDYRFYWFDPVNALWNYAKLTVAGTTYTESNVTTDRTYDANATTINELADVVGTLIADLRTAGIIN